MGDAGAAAAGSAYRGQIPSPGRPPVARREHRVRFWAAIARGVERGAAARPACRSAGRRPVVPPEWRDAVALPAVAVGPLLVLRRARGDRASCARRGGCARDRPAAGAIAVDDLAGAAPQRRDPRWPARLPGDNRAVARRAAGPATEGRRSWPRTSGCASTCRTGSPARSHARTARACRAGGALDRPPARPPRKIDAGRRSWSPEQIANRLPVDFPDDESMRISHEAIYQSLYVQGRGALRVS